MLTLQQIEDAKLWLNEQRQVVNPGPKQVCWEALDVMTAIVREQARGTIAPTSNG